MAREETEAEFVKPVRAAMRCACANLRQASRAITQTFDDALRPADIRATQLGVLLVTRAAGCLTVGQLAELLVMDRTTLARNLQPLERRELLRIECGEDRRVRSVTLTPKGHALIAKALPLWEDVQTRLIDGMGQQRFDCLLGDLDSAILAAQNV